MGIEGIHRLDDVQKLPSGWEEYCSRVICNNFQEEATKYNDDIRLHLEEGDSLLEARIKVMGNYVKYPEGML